MEVYSRISTFLYPALFIQFIHFCQALVYFLIAQAIIGEIACQVLVVSAHVDQAVSGEVEKKHFLFAAFFAFQCFINGGSDGVA